MSELTKKAIEKEKSGDYAAAAQLYALHAFERLIRDNFEYSRSTRINSTILLESISCDVRAGNTKRPTYIFTLLRPLLMEGKDEATDDVLIGLYEEWFGDAKLMLGMDGAVTHYEKAADYYTDTQPVEPWGFEEEFDYAHWAFTSFANSKGYQLPERANSNFKARIQFKVRMANELLTE